MSLADADMWIVDLWPESVDRRGFKILVSIHPWHRRNGRSSSTHDIVAAHQVITVWLWRIETKQTAHWQTDTP